MKKMIKILLVALTFLCVSAYAGHHEGDKAKAEMNKSAEKAKKGLYQEKKDVADTSMEEPDQTDPKLIEGNLEDNDFKN